MSRSTVSRLLVLFWLLFAGIGDSAAGDTNIAVASNFAEAVKLLASRYEQQGGEPVRLIFGSTGKHYAQIRNGAPFAAFLAADAWRPELLEQQGIAIAGSRFTYALGKIVLWSPQPTLIDAGGAVLSSDRFTHLAIANPRLAPYGKAAQQFLQARGLWEDLQGRLVRGENIAQTYQFVKSGSAELGIVAYSQVKRPGQRPEGSMWEIPPASYEPIAQQAVLLRDDPVARGFLDYLKSGEGQEIIRGFGYEVETGY